MSNWQDKYHYEKATGKHACSNCDAFLKNNGGQCIMFKAPVESDSVCDEWTDDYKTSGWKTSTQQVERFKYMLHGPTDQFHIWQAYGPSPMSASPHHTDVAKKNGIADQYEDTTFGDAYVDPATQETNLRTYNVVPASDPDRASRAHELAQQWFTGQGHKLAEPGTYYNEKLGAQQVMYHVAPRSARESILGGGLKPAPSPADAMWEESQPAVHLWDNDGDAYDWIDHSNDMHDWAAPWDVWEVNHEGLPLGRDPNMRNSWLHEDTIPPNRLRLLSEGTTAKTAGWEVVSRQQEGDEEIYDSPHGPYTMHYRTEDQGERKPRHVIDAFHPQDGKVGELNWYGTTGTIHHIGVEEDHSRRGLATAMWNWGQTMSPRPQHSGDRTEQGTQWARSVGGPGIRRAMAQLAPSVTQELTQHIEELAKTYGIGIDWADTDYPHARMGDIEIRPIRTDHDYFTALHEIGHIASGQADRGDVKGLAGMGVSHDDRNWSWQDHEPPLHSGEEDIEDEAAHWRWAAGISRIPVTPEMWHEAIHGGAQTYYDHEKANPWYTPEEGVPEYPRTGPHWQWLQQQRTAALETKDYPGEYGNRSHITRVQTGTVPTSAVATMPGVKGEVPGEHHDRYGEDWENFKNDIRQNGIREPLFVTVDSDTGPMMNEGNRRRDAAVELGLQEVPVEIRYFGHSEMNHKIARGKPGAPSYVEKFLQGLHPEESHGIDSDCINPKCAHHWSPEEEHELLQYGEIKCPECHTLQTIDGNLGSFSDQQRNYGDKPGGQTRAGITLGEMGRIGQEVVKRAHIPGFTFKHEFTEPNWPVDHIWTDENGQDHGMEIKTNHSLAQPRFKLGDAKERAKKIQYATQNGLRQGLIGVRLNFHHNTADVFHRPQFTDTWVGAPSMTHVGTFDFSDLNPFKSPGEVPTNLPEEHDDIPF